MADLPSVFVKVHDIEVNEDAPVDEVTLNKLGQNDNYLKDALDANITARISGDSANSTNLNAIKSNLNTAVSIHRLVGSGTLSSGVEAIQAEHYLDVRFIKDTGLNVSTVSLHVVNGDDPAFETSANMGLSTGAWDYAYYYWDAQNDRIVWYAFAGITVAVP